MTHPPEPLALDRMLAPLGDCMTPEVARRVAELRPDPGVQARVDYLAERANEGRLTDEERDEYESVVRAGNFIAILKAKARRLLADSLPT